MKGTLMTESDTRRVDRHELALVETPEPSGSWYPVAHSRVVDEVQRNLMLSGFRMTREEYALAKGDQQFFGVIDLESQLGNGVTLSVGVRNSTNKTLSAAMCLGERVFVCDNLCFGGEVAIAHKHTRFVESGFRGKVETAISGLHQYVQVSQDRIASLQERRLEPAEADSLLLRSYEQNVIGARLLPKLISEWRQPTFTEFEVPTLWSMLQAFTHVMKDRQKARPIEAATECMRFQNFLLAA